MSSGATTAPTWTMHWHLPQTIQPCRLPVRTGITDEDYFLHTIACGQFRFLTVEGMDDTTSATENATTNGTLFGPFGEIATDTNSGADGTHFSFVSASRGGDRTYLVQGDRHGRGLRNLSCDPRPAGGTVTTDSTVPAPTRPDNGIAPTIMTLVRICPPCHSGMQLETATGIASTLRIPGPCTCRPPADR